MQQKIYDCVVVGCGATGLSALINGASEGLSILGIDSNPKVGGLIGTTSRIENYPGFPDGIQGCDLVEKMGQQALKFGAEFLLNTRVEEIGKVEALERNNEGNDFNYPTYFSLGVKSSLDNESPYCATDHILTKSVIVCTGRWHKKLGLLNEEELVRDKKLFYGHPPTDNTNVKGHIVIVGGGNSAGQAATWLTHHACKVTIICPSFKVMSQYLIDRLLSQLSGVQVIMGKVVHIHQASADLLVTSRESPTSHYQTVHCDKVYSLIGLEVLDDFKELLDNSGFMVDGKVPGIIVAGDCRKDSEKRCTAAVGEGVQAISKVHQYLATLN